LGAADIMVGNSSSGIIEAGSFGLPVLNIGDRQHGRERNENTVDLPPTYTAVRDAALHALAGGRRPIRNVYGDGRAGDRILEFLATLPLTAELLKKYNAY
ncbi:MAG TPA: UDP-N-acetylglucosamine 2-epimerase, partial [Lacunisphaera sp.]|nr:UDP-N-acetylglucosamine 2-epimerase [Lacunisphaera sp.]